MTSTASPFTARLARLFDVRPEEIQGVLAGLALFFLLFASYFMLRPVRETMGIAGGIENLQWLFTATFVSSLLVLPLFGWLAARVPRRQILPWTYGFFTLNLVAFAIGFVLDPENVWAARVFYVWLSVFNLLSISLAWSVLADLFASAQARRLFAMMAGGASLGGLTGPLLSTLLVGTIGHAGLLVLSAALLAAAIGAAYRLQRWRDANPLKEDETVARRRPLGGSPFAGATAVLKSPFLIGIAVFVLLLASVNTFLYFEQAHLVKAAFPDRADQTRVFGTLDIVVQTLAILTQVFFTGRIAQRLGVGILLVAVPLVVAAGFLWMAVAPVFAVFAVVMVVRRAGEYALVRPGREMLFTAVSPEAKYKAKNFIDTVVYRGADALSAWVKALIDMIASHPALAALIGAAISLVWGLTGGLLALQQRRLEATQARQPSTPPGG
ncbi:MAG TPA: MFS transporter [Dokdonella sp.]|uniref:NTP/NDP exchange transporter n=1 Tax=Dokdonella sp. TaxID=2291710 RepID=UPI002B62FC65|nr:MFS transporter [Dokdonella sp.]HUD42763.1 MFS transporter [Dokdonella sp.]